jgi:hypothetical protein
MPVKKITLKGLKGFRYGRSGKFYSVKKYGEKGAEEKAKKQGAAIHISQVRASGRARGYERRL